MNKLVELIFARRGMDSDTLIAIEDPSHRKLEGIETLCDRLKELHDNNSKIVILPDYDMDGIMSGTLGYAGMSQLGFNVELFIPNPADGYGFDKPQVIDRLIEKHPGVQTILTCDCGISCSIGAQYANEHGLEVLVTDHHIEKEDTSVRPYATVTVDPCALNERYEHPQICGAHVLWQCLYEYAFRYGTPDDVLKIEKLRVFAGIGTISDTMPVLYENRVLLRNSIDINRSTWEAGASFKSFIDGAHENYKRAFRGLYAACKVFSNEARISELDDIDETFFGFYMAPTFNAVKRLDGDMSKAFGVFFGDHPIDDMRYLYQLNEERKQVVNEKIQEVETQENPYAPYCYISDAPAGVLGLLATKLADTNGRPCIVLNEHPDGHYSGSGRSPAWYPLNTRLTEQGFHVAGHEGAFGCSFNSTSQLDDLYSFMCKDVEAIAETADMIPPSDFTISVDGANADTPIDQALFLEYMDEIQEYRPFGRGFEEPTALLEFNMTDATWNVIGKDKTHLKFSLPNSFDVLCWGQAKYGLDGMLEHNKNIIVSGKLAVNEFRGQRKAQFIGDVVAISD